MIRLSIKRKIIGIAVTLIALMTVTALISLALVMQVSGRLDQLAQSYAPAYAAIARANVHSLERAVALRRMTVLGGSGPMGLVMSALGVGFLIGAPLMEVSSIVVATAMPKAAARLSEERKPIVSASVKIINVQLTKPI